MLSETETVVFRLQFPTKSIIIVNYEHNTTTNPTNRGISSEFALDSDLGNRCRNRRLGTTSVAHRSITRICEISPISPWSRIRRDPIPLPFRVHLCLAPACFGRSGPRTAGSHHHVGACRRVLCHHFSNWQRMVRYLT